MDKPDTSQRERLWVEVYLFRLKEDSWIPSSCASDADSAVKAFDRHNPSHIETAEPDEEDF